MVTPPTVGPSEGHAEAAGGDDYVGLDDGLVRYDRQLLADPEIQERLRRAGYVECGRVLDDGQLLAVRQVAFDFLDSLTEPWGEAFLTTGRISDPVLRAEATQRTADLVLPALAPYFIPEVRLRGSALQIKPPSHSSELNSHQDSSLVDERRWLGVYAWIALDDTGVHNGGLHVLPGSHRFGNLQRTLNIPWQLARFGEIMAELSVPLAVPAGSLVLFDAATVHSSPPNHSEEIRLAVNSFASHRDAHLMHYFRDETTTDGTVEAYEIDDNFFFEADIMARPSPPSRFLGEWMQHRIDWSPEEFEALAHQAMDESR